MAVDPSEVRSAQCRIFNRLCVEYLRTRSEAFLRANDLCEELSVPAEIFHRALMEFKAGDSSAVEITQTEGEMYLRLGESARYNCE